MKNKSGGAHNAPKKSFALTMAILIISMLSLSACAFTGQKEIFRLNSVMFDGSEPKALITAELSPKLKGEKIDWEMRFADADSEWAKGKTAEEYVRLTVEKDGTAVTAECLQPFGEQIEIVAKPRRYPELKQVCTADYLQKIENASLRFGDLEMDLNGEDTEVYFAADGEALGGKTNVQIETSEVYTIENTFTYEVLLSGAGYNPGQATTKCVRLSGLDINADYHSEKFDLTGRTLKFDTAFFTEYHLYFLLVATSTVIELKDYPKEQLPKLFEEILYPSNFCYIDLIIHGTDREYAYRGNFKLTGYKTGG